MPHTARGPDRPGAQPGRSGTGAVELACEISELTIATLGLREHYLIDLVVAVPFAVAVHVGMGPTERRGDKRGQLVVTLAGAAMTVGGLLTIRYGTACPRHVPSLAPGLVLATTVASAG